MSTTNERIEQLLADTRRLCMAISDAAVAGYISDEGGTLQRLGHQAMESARHVEYDLNADDLAAQDAVEEDEHLMASYDNDLGDVS